MVEGLFATLTNVSFDDKAIAELTDRVHQEKARLRPDCGGCASPCGHNDDYDMNRLWKCTGRYPLPEIPDSFWNPRNGGLRLPCADAWIYRSGGI